MEPESYLIEKCFHEVMHYFTMTNIKCKGNKEIDLILQHYTSYQNCAITMCKMNLTENHG